jgi:hypothetical protein
MFSRAQAKSELILTEKATAGMLEHQVADSGGSEIWRAFCGFRGASR